MPLHWCRCIDHKGSGHFSPTKHIGALHDAQTTWPRRSSAPPDHEGQRAGCAASASRNFLVAVLLASARLWLKHYEATT